MVGAREPAGGMASAFAVRLAAQLPPTLSNWEKASRLPQLPQGRALTRGSANDAAGMAVARTQPCKRQPA